MGIDEGAIARELETTLSRFRGEARAALGLGPAGDVATARAAFMALAKRYHPAKYARLSPPVVRLANETFLAIRRAYDTVLAESSQAPVGRATLPRQATGPVATVAAPRQPTGPVATVAAPRQPTGPVATVAARGPAPSRAATPSARPPNAASPSAASPSAASPSAASPAPPRAPSTSPRRDPPPPHDDRFDRAIDHLRARRWAEARPILSTLASEAPGDVRYRAYLHYLRGWEAHELGKDAEARAEWRRALACDPGLGMAQWALQATGLA